MGAIPGIIGAGIAFCITKNDFALSRVTQVANNSAGPVYLSWWFLKLMVTQIAANLGTARRCTGVNVPDQHVYKVVGGPADGSSVLMDDKHPAYGRFNRAQRALALFNETLGIELGNILLGSYVFPWTTALCTTLYSCCRVKGAFDYTDERTKRMSGNMLGNLFSSGIGGMVLTIGIYATNLELKKAKASSMW